MSRTYSSPLPEQYQLLTAELFLQLHQLFEIPRSGAREMAPWLRTQAFLAQEPDAAPSTHMVVPNHPKAQLQET